MTGGGEVGIMMVGVDGLNAIYTRKKILSAIISRVNASPAVIHHTPGGHVRGILIYCLVFHVGGDRYIATSFASPTWAITGLITPPRAHFTILKGFNASFTTRKKDNRSYRK